MYNRFKNKIIFISKKKEKTLYYNILANASSLVCPTECNFGNFVPTKILEYAASGAAILTNCNLISYDMKDLDEFVIHYKSLDDLEEKLKIDFTPYYGKAVKAAKNHTHKIRYRELFG